MKFLIYWLQIAILDLVKKQNPIPTFKHLEFGEADRVLLLVEAMQLPAVIEAKSLLTPKAIEDQIVQSCKSQRSEPTQKNLVHNTIYTCNSILGWRKEEEMYQGRELNGK